MVTGGGGGHGDPFQRPAEDVLEEVRAEYITAAQAREDYGVVVAADGRSIDTAGTSRLRAGSGL
jgi:N-methylhydantoinase B